MNHFNNRLGHRIWICAGGTGGHIAPATSLAMNFIKKKCSVVFITLEKDMSYPDIQKLKDHKNIDVFTYKAERIPRNVLQIFTFISTFLHSLSFLNRLRKKYPPGAVLAMGGYPVFNVLVWSKIHRVPYFICEQNTVLGRINKLFKKRAKKVFLSFPIDHHWENYVISGNPLRESIIFKKKEFQHLSKAKILPKTIFIIGGSQGANDLNELYLKMIEDSFFAKTKIFISTGEKYFKKIISKRRKKDEVYSFINDMKKFLMKSDCVISRSGSSMLFEILSSRKPAIFLPYPYATHNHQKENALFLKKKGLAAIVDIRPFDAENSLEEIKNILISKEFVSIRDNMQKHSIPLDAHEKITDMILQYIPRFDPH